MGETAPASKPCRRLAVLWGKNRELGVSRTGAILREFPWKYKTGRLFAIEEEWSAG